MTIYTSYYAKSKKIPEDIVRISIAGKAPEYYTGIQYKALAPKYGFLWNGKGITIMTFILNISIPRFLII
jgi:hypothetical protein